MDIEMKRSRLSPPMDSLTTRSPVNRWRPGAAVLLLAVVLFGHAMYAATFTWDGGGANDNWSTALNWVGDSTPPLLSGANDFAFAGATRLTPQMETDYTVHGISFSSGASSFTIQSTAGGIQTLTLGSGGVANNSANAQALNVEAILLAAVQSWNAAAGSLSSSSAIALGGFTLTLDGASNTALSGNVTGAGGLAKAGTGTLTLSGGNSSYTGVTTINNGVVNIRDNSSLGATGAGNGTTVASGAALELQGATITYDSEAVTLNGTGISDGGALRNISGANTWSGAITLGSASRINSEAGLVLSGGITGTGLGLTMGGSGITTISTAGINTSTGGTLTKDGSGTLTITIGGSYTGTTTISAGVVNIQNATALGTGTGGAVSVTSGAALQLQGGITVASPKALTLNGTGISADGALRNISGNNTWAGTITLGSATRINSDANDLTLSGGITGDGNALALGGAGDVTISSAIAGIGTALTKDGTGAVFLNGASPNTYNGVTAVNEGLLVLSKTAGINAIAGNLTIGDGSATATVQLTAANQIADTSAVTINTGGVFDLNTLAETIGSISGSGSVTLGAGGALTVGDASSTTYSGTISQAGGLTKVGSGTLTFSGGSANTYSGTTTVNAGSLILNKNTGVNAIGGALIVGDGTGTDTVQWGANNEVPTVAVTVNGSGVLDLNTFSDTVGNLTVNGGGVTTRGGSLTIGTLSMTGGSIATAGGTLTLGGPVTGNASSSSATISGNLALGADRTFTIADQVGLADDMVISAAISGGAGVDLIKSGAGTLVLGGDNTSYVGLTTINSGGALNIRHANALGGVGTGTTVNSGGALQIQGAITTAAEPLTINGTGVATDGALRNISDNNIYAGVVTVDQTGGTAIRINSDAGTLTVSAGINESGNALKTLTIGGAGNVTIAGNITADGGDLALAKDGAGALTLSGTGNNYDGGTTLTGGNLALGADNVIPDAGTFTFAGGILKANDRTDHIGALSLTVNSTLDFSAGGSAGFLSFNGGPAAPGALTLTINNWTGLANSSGTDDRVYLRDAANAPVIATADFLNSINFTGFGFAPGAIQLASGEIVPVPEPINIALGIFALFGIFHRLRSQARRQAWFQLSSPQSKTACGQAPPLERF